MRDWHFPVALRRDHRFGVVLLDPVADLVGVPRSSFAGRRAGSAVAADQALERQPLQQGAGLPAAAACPGVSGKNKGRPGPSTTAWILVVRTAARSGRAHSTATPRAAREALRPAGGRVRASRPRARRPEGRRGTARPRCPCKPQRRQRPQTVLGSLSPAGNPSREAGAQHQAMALTNRRRAATSAFQMPGMAASLAWSDAQTASRKRCRGIRAVVGRGIPLLLGPRPRLPTRQRAPSRARRESNAPPTSPA